MGGSLRIGLLIFVFCLMAFVGFMAGCANRDEARQQAPFRPAPDSKIPEATPGPGWEKVQQRPDSTPTPRPSSPMDKPLDPTGLPQG